MREKLIELLYQKRDCICDLCGTRPDSEDRRIEAIAEHLIANGMTLGKDTDVPATDDDGCDFCRENWADETWDEGGAHDFRLSQNALFYYDPIFGWEGMDVVFCPVCGRKLPEAPKEEA